MMTKKTKAELALEAYLASLTKKSLLRSDTQIIASNNLKSNTSWRESQKKAGKNRSKNNEEWYNNFIKANEKVVSNKKENGVYVKWSEQMKCWRDSEEGQIAIKEAAKKSSISMKGKNNKIIITPDGEFHSLTDAAKFYNIIKASMLTRMEYHPELYYYKENGPGKLRVMYKFMTEYGPVKSKVVAHKLAKQNNNQSALDTTSVHYWFDTMCKKYPKKYYKI